jgi:hypothetical protein
MLELNPTTPPMGVVSVLVTAVSCARLSSPNGVIV